MNENDVREATPDPTDDAVHWAALVTAELDIASDDLARLSRSVLDMVRDVAHGVNRPSAPLTAFLVGLAAGRAAQASGTSIDVEVQMRLEQVMHLVQSWETANEQ
ncbi:MAG: DUF6457 domain-containing protein [Cellulomonas sp.]